MSRLTTGAADEVWYVAYGSNLLRARFLAYLNGCDDDEPWGAHHGAADPSPPRDDRRVEVPHPVMFGGYSTRWEGGCCFCLPTPITDDRPPPVGRAWLVTRSQLADIVAQENHMPTDTTTIPDSLPAPGVPVRVIDGVIDLLLVLPPMDGIPVATLASSDPPPAGPPAPRYRSVVAAGMAEMGMSPQEVEAHLTDLDRS